LLGEAGFPICAWKLLTLYLLNVYGRWPARKSQQYAQDHPFVALIDPNQLDVLLNGWIPSENWGRKIDSRETDSDNHTTEVAFDYGEGY
jgi:hypothetical protein